MASGNLGLARCSALALVGVMLIGLFFAPPPRGTIGPGSAHDPMALPAAPSPGRFGDGRPVNPGGSWVGPDPPPGFVESTLTLWNNTLTAGNTRPLGPESPGAAAFDSSSNTLFVAGASGTNGTVSAVSMPNGTFERATVVGTGEHPPAFATSAPAALLVLPSLNQLWAASPYSDNLTVLNASTLAIQDQIRVGPGAEGLTYDPTVHRVYVTVGPAANVSVINVTSDAIVANIPVGAGPNGIAYDAQSGDLYVVNSDPFGPQGDTVGIIDVSSNAMIATIPVGIFPGPIAVDPAHGELDVLSSYAFVRHPSVVNVISVAARAVVANLTVGNGGPTGIAYDPANGSILVTEGGNFSVPGTNLTVINDTRLAVVGNVTVGSDPSSAVYATPEDAVLVINGGSQNFTWLNATTLASVRSIPLGFQPLEGAFDPATGAFYIADQNGAAVLVISSASQRLVATIPVGREPTSVAVDASANLGFSTNLASNNLTVFSTGTDRPVASVPVGREPIGIAYDPAVDRLFVANLGSDSVSVLSASSLDLLTTIPVGDEPDSVLYLPAWNEIAVANLGSGNVSLLNASADRVVASIPVGADPFGLGYDPTSSVLYVGSLIGSHITSIALPYAAVGSIPVGSSPLGVSFDRLDGAMLTANFGSSNVTVVSTESGRPIGSLPTGSQPVAILRDPAAGLSLVTNRGQGTLSFLYSVRFPVTFSETGLPNGTDWGIRLSNGPSGTANASVLTLLEVNGSHSFVVTSGDPTYQALGGTFSIAGASTQVTVPFFRVVFAVTVTERGLPPGTEWGVTLPTGMSVTSQAPSLSFLEPNGTYALRPGMANRSYSAPSVTVLVDGAPVSAAVTFQEVVYSVTFAESGLPPGTVWWVNLTGGASYVSTGPTLSFSAPNGSYSYIASSIGFPSVEGSFAVDGGPPSVLSVAFARPSPATAGLGGPVYFAADVAGIAIAGAGVYAGLVVRRWLAGPRRAETAHQ